MEQQTLSVVRQIEGAEFNADQAVAHLGAVAPAYGRGEVLVVGDAGVQLILVKNPSGFQISLDSAVAAPTMIAINDEYADGRDVSWLWDVSFARLRQLQAPVVVTGVRAADMAVRLMYDGVPEPKVEPDMNMELRRWVRSLGGATGQIFATLYSDAEDSWRVRANLNSEVERG